MLEIILFLPELFLGCFILLNIINCLLTTTIYVHANGKFSTATTFFSGMHSFLIAIFGTLSLTINNLDKNFTLYNYTILSDSITHWTKIVTLLLSLCATLLLIPYFQRMAHRPFEFIANLGFYILSLLMLVQAADLMLTYLAFELFSFAAYTLLPGNKYNLLSFEAAFKYFVLSALASCFMLLGIAGIYNSTGTTNLMDLRRAYVSNPAESRES